MIIFDQTSIAFIKRAQEMLRDILVNIDIPVRTSRFLFKGYLYPIKVVVFEGESELGHFNAPYFQIGLNKKLVYLAKDSVLRDILKHELAHYLTWITFGDVSPHGEEFKTICRQFEFPREISAATMNLDVANLSKVGDLESERVLEKVKKLLQLAQSSNTHEAELATMKANALLLRHNLDRLQFENEDEPLYLDRVMVQKRKDAKMIAIYDILKHFLVKPVMSFGKGSCCLEISGTLTNVKLAVYIVHFLESEMDFLWNSTKKEHHLQGLRSKNSFFLGLAKGFDEKMKASKDNFTADEQKALVVVEKNLAKKIHHIYGRLSHSHTGHETDERATALGVQKGRELSIRKGVETSSRNLLIGFHKG